VNSKGELMAQPYTIRVVNGVRLGIIGVLTAHLREMSLPESLGEWRTLPVADAVKKYAAEIKSRADIIIVLGHILSEEEDAILNAVPEVNVLVDGHHHNGLEHEKLVGGRPVIRVKARGIEIGRFDMEVDVPAKRVKSWTWRRIPVSSANFAAAPDVEKVVAKWEARVKEKVDVEIGESKREFDRAGTKALMEQALKEETGADFGYTNLGGVRANLPARKLLARDIWNVMPFDNVVMIAKVKGAELPAKVTNGQPVDPNKTYTLATHEFVAGNQKTEFGKGGIDFHSFDGKLVRDLMIEWVKKKKVID
jgi:2',3'-cyclic-nucleotide 2'-phosphodiesterase (5'-nucleotidase family)